MDRKSTKMKDPQTKNASQCARNLTRHAFLKVIIRVSKQVKKRRVHGKWHRVPAVPSDIFGCYSFIFFQ